MPACAITDHTNLFSLVKFYSGAQKAGIKPIIGADMMVRENDELHRLVLLCQDYEGYLNISRLISKAYTHGQKLGVPAISREWLNDWNEGLICLSGGAQGDLGKSLLSGKTDQAVEQLKFWRQHFPDRFYLQLQRTGREQEEDYLHAAVNLALDTHTPVVAVNDVRFLQADDFEAHEVRVGIHDGYTLDNKNRPRRYSREQYLRSAAEMIELFSDIPEAIDNTVLIAQRCNLTMTLGKNFLPKFPTGDLSTADYLREESKKGLEKRLTFLFPGEEDSKRAPYDERLDIELNVINSMDFPGYFLIVADFIQWAKDNGVPVGPGRGSGAGSLVAYALSITDLDPLAYDLLFERFLNPERVSMPDFDVDFCMEGRDRVIDYVAQHYGREKVSQIITYGSMAAKAVVRDVGRVLGHPYGFVDQIAKLIPFDLGMTLDKALEQEEQLQARYDHDDEVKTLLDMARKLEGLTRNAGKHAGGVVISPTALTDFSPLYCEEGETNVVTQFDKNDVEAVGLVKFDFLGLRTLTIIDWALDNVRLLDGKEKLDILTIPLNDKPSFDLLKRGTTTAVFQLESRGMQEMIKRLKPSCFEDIIALVALYRPGPLQSGMVDDFINRKHGAKVEYPHPDVEPILKPTYGVILYQEQVMQIAQVLAGYSLGGADLLRRAMGKKKPEEMAKQRDIFMKGAIERQVDAGQATYIFDLMEKFAGYGFNKSHSAAYALVSYQTAWLKVHHPAAFMAAVLSADMDNTDKVVMLIEECRSMKLEILPPHINSSDYKFAVSSTQDKAIHYGLGAIKGAGEAALLVIVEERKSKGTFTDLFDFCQRIDLRKCNRRVLDSLIRAGALDDLGDGSSPSREVLTASLDTALKMAEQEAQVQSSGQNDLFGGLFSEPTAKVQNTALPYAKQVEIWTEHQRLAGEKDTLGLYLTGHPIDHYLEELGHFSKRLNTVKPTGRGQNMTVAGLVLEVRVKNTNRGKMAFLTLDDKSSRLEVKMYSDTYEKYRELLQKDEVLIIAGEVAEDRFNGGLNMSAETIQSMGQARDSHAKQLRLNIKHDQTQNDLISRLETLFNANKEGQCPVVIEYQYDARLTAELSLGKEWCVRPAEEFLQDLRKELGKDRVRLIYK